MSGWQDTGYVANDGAIKISSKQGRRMKGERFDNEDLISLLSNVRAPARG
jgi:hypothetical protein